MVLRRAAGLALVGLAALASSTWFAAQSDGHFHPLAVLVSLLPLQVAGLLWVLTTAPAAAARRLPGPRPPASEG